MKLLLRERIECIGCQHPPCYPGGIYPFNPVLSEIIVVDVQSSNRRSVYVDDHDGPVCGIAYPMDAFVKREGDIGLTRQAADALRLRQPGPPSTNVLPLL